ncbi:MAG: hypothetical protein ABI813_00040 [Bacteroidota bacterium]
MSKDTIDCNKTADRSLKTHNRKQAFEEGTLDNTGKINQSNQQLAIENKTAEKKQKDKPSRP